ncbi:uncharacterized protein LOC124111023 [Haliotis rufescens]|uniref:uncharacterized protein LOC124111023 n=1 Tax=Haliotis rufescens TaxID=6454 RepID=UPI00201F70D1|nr:uncharacterized protein LOC124111023 [Haliotis rufescens]
MEKELWEMDLYIIRRSKHNFGDTKVANTPEQPCLPHPDSPRTPGQEMLAVTLGTKGDITCNLDVKVQKQPAETLAGPLKTVHSIKVDSKMKNSLLQTPQTDLRTQLEERDRFGFEFSQFKKILVEIREKRISFNKQIKILQTDIAALPKVRQDTRLNSIKTKVTAYRNQSKRLSYEGRQLLESMQNNLWDMDLHIIRESGHCNNDAKKQVPPSKNCLPHQVATSDTSVVDKTWRPNVSKAANDEGVNRGMKSSTTSARSVRPTRKRNATIASPTSCSSTVLKKPLLAPSLAKRVKKKKGMTTVTNTSFTSSSRDKPTTSGNQVPDRPTEKEVMMVETKASHKTSRDTLKKSDPSASAIHIHLTQKVNPTALNASHVSSQGTFRKSDHTTPAIKVKLTKEKPMTAATNASNSSCSGDDLKRKSDSAAIQTMPCKAATLRPVTAGTGDSRKMSLQEARTVLQILQMQHDLLVTSMGGIRLELDLGQQEDCIWRSTMDELDTELHQTKRSPNNHRVASLRAKATYLRVQMSTLSLRGNVYLTNMERVIAHLTCVIRGVRSKIMAASYLNT